MKIILAAIGPVQIEATDLLGENRYRISPRHGRDARNHADFLKCCYASQHIRAAIKQKGAPKEERLLFETMFG
jgi:hypothetical protein